MIFGFPETARTTFNQTFLRSVTFYVTFNPVTNLTTKKEFVKDLFSKDFPIIEDSVTNNFQISNDRTQTPIINVATQQNGFILKSSNGLKTIAIASNEFTYTIQGDHYSGFDDITTVFSKIEKFFLEFAISFVNKIAIRKINIISVKGAADYNSIDPLKSLINADLIQPTIALFRPGMAIQKSLQNFSCRNSQYSLILNYGVAAQPSFPPEKSDNIIIDIDLGKDGHLDKWQEDANSINSEIFNIFMWSTSNQLHDILAQNVIQK